MDIKTYRAKTMRDALELVRRELGPSASVLHTREVNGGPLRRLVFGRKYEVAASATMNVPSRLPVGMQEASRSEARAASISSSDSYLDARSSLPASGVELDLAYPAEGATVDDYRARYRDDFRRQVAGQLDELHAMVEKLCDHAA